MAAVRWPPWHPCRTRPRIGGPSQHPRRCHWRPRRATAQPAEVWAEKTQEAMDHEKSEEDEKQDTWRMVQVEDVGIFVKCWLRIFEWLNWFLWFSVWLLGLIIIFVGILDGILEANRFCSLLPSCWVLGPGFFCGNLGDFCFLTWEMEDLIHMKLGLRFWFCWGDPRDHLQRVGPRILETVI